MLKSLVKLVALAKQVFDALLHFFQLKPEPRRPPRHVYLVRVYTPSGCDPYRNIPNKGASIYTESAWLSYVEAREYADNLHDAMRNSYSSGRTALEPTAWTTMCPVDRDQTEEYNQFDPPKKVYIVNCRDCRVKGHSNSMSPWRTASLVSASYDPAQAAQKAKESQAIYTNWEFWVEGFLLNDYSDSD